MLVISSDVPLWSVAEREGEVPLPPYIERPRGPSHEDASDYQTIFAKQPGAAAAPTASLHFTDRVLEALRERGVHLAPLTLHVGPGTFLPIRQEHEADIRSHVMHEELYEIPEATLAAIGEAHDSGGRLIAVGTTVVRALETYAGTGVAAGASSLFIYPGFQFRLTQGLVTNFHLPRSTLLAMVCAFAGRERVLAAYAEALAAGYRFFSYGDAMLIWP